MTELVLAVATVSLVIASTPAAALAAGLEGWRLSHLGISVAGVKQGWLRDFAQEVLHFQGLEHFAFPLEDKNLDARFIELSSASPCVCVFSQRGEDVLHLQDGALSVDLIDKALLVEFDSHGLKSSCLSQSFVLPLDKEADGSHTVALLCLLQPVVHDCCKIDIIGQLALA